MNGVKDADSQVCCEDYGMEISGALRSMIGTAHMLYEYQSSSSSSSNTIVLVGLQNTKIIRTGPPSSSTIRLERVCFCIVQEGKKLALTGEGAPTGRVWRGLLEKSGVELCLRLEKQEGRRRRVEKEGEGAREGVRETERETNPVSEKSN